MVKRENINLSVFQLTVHDLVSSHSEALQAVEELVFVPAIVSRK